MLPRVLRGLIKYPRTPMQYDTEGSEEGRLKWVPHYVEKRIQKEKIPSRLVINF